MNFKRRKTKRSVTCTMCTQHRWKGNSGDRFKPREAADRRRIREDQRARLYDDL